MNTPLSLSFLLSPTSPECTDHQPRRRTPRTCSVDSSILHRRFEDYPHLLIATSLQLPLASESGLYNIMVDSHSSSTADQLLSFDLDSTRRERRRHDSSFFPAPRSEGSLVSSRTLDPVQTPLELQMTLKPIDSNER